MFSAKTQFVSDFDPSSVPTPPSGGTGGYSDYEIFNAVDLGYSNSDWFETSSQPDGGVKAAVANPSDPTQIYTLDVWGDLYFHPSTPLVQNTLDQYTNSTHRIFPTWYAYLAATRITLSTDGLEMLLIDEPNKKIIVVPFYEPPEDIAGGGFDFGGGSSFDLSGLV